MIFVCEKCGIVVEKECHKTQRFCSKQCFYESKNKGRNQIQKNRDYRQKWKEKDPQRAKRVSRRAYETWYLSVPGRASMMLTNCRGRAKKLGLRCTLTKEWFIEHLSPMKCEVTGLPLVLEVNKRQLRTNSWSPSIDRIDQTGGYVPENCRITSWLYNHARGAFPEEDFFTLIRALQETKT